MCQELISMRVTGICCYYWNQKMIKHGKHSLLVTRPNMVIIKWKEAFSGS